MATFEAQISAQITQQIKDRLGELVNVDAARGRCSEADVIRVALQVGLPDLERVDPERRLELYARARAGLPWEDSAGG